MVSENSSLEWSIWRRRWITSGLTFLMVTCLNRQSPSSGVFLILHFIPIEPFFRVYHRKWGWKVPWLIRRVGLVWFTRKQRQFQSNCWKKSLGRDSCVGWDLCFQPQCRLSSFNEDKWMTPSSPCVVSSTNTLSALWFVTVLPGKKLTEIYHGCQILVSLWPLRTDDCAAFIIFVLRIMGNNPANGTPRRASRTLGKSSSTLHAHWTLPALWRCPWIK